MFFGLKSVVRVVLFVPGVGVWLVCGFVSGVLVFAGGEQCPGVGVFS